MSFLMIPLTTLFDEYTNRTKLTEKKTVEHIVPRPLRWVGTVKVGIA